MNNTSGSWSPECSTKSFDAVHVEDRHMKYLLVALQYMCMYICMLYGFDKCGGLMNNALFSETNSLGTKLDERVWDSN